MLSILLHEVGHFMVLVYYGLKPSMFFIPMLGAAVAAKDIDKKLNHYLLAILALAGPGVNFLLVLIGLFLRLNNDPLGLRLASLNSALVWFNLIPILILDGKRFMKAIYASLDERGNRTIAWLITILALLTGL